MHSSCTVSLRIHLQLKDKDTPSRRDAGGTSVVYRTVLIAMDTHPLRREVIDTLTRDLAVSPNKWSTLMTELSEVRIARMDIVFAEL